MRACALSDVLQDVKDKLHHNRLVTPLPPPAVYDGGKHAIQGVEVPSWEVLPIAPGHKSHLKLQHKPLVLIQSHLEGSCVNFRAMSYYVIES